jgi:hypothetical protein
MIIFNSRGVVLTVDAINKDLFTYGSVNTALKVYEDLLI